MACKCFETLGAKLKEHLKERFGNEIADLDEARWTNSVFVMTEGDHASVTVPYSFKYFKRRKNGELEKRRTSADTFMTMQYCPFCGTKFEGKPQKEETAA